MLGRQMKAREKEIKMCQQVWRNKYGMMEQVWEMEDKMNLPRVNRLLINMPHH